MTRLLLPIALVAAACEPSVAEPVPPDIPTALAVSPDVVGRGQQVTFELITADGPFDAEDLEADFGGGLEVLDLWSQDRWHAFATVQIDPDAELGLRDVSVAAGDWSQISHGAVRIIAESFTVDPARAGRGELVEVQLEGVGTDWTFDSWPVFGEGIDVVDLVVSDPTHATARIAVAPDAEVGRRDVLLGDLVLHDGFTVDADVITMTLDIQEIPQGALVYFVIDGQGTSWEDGTEVELWDAGGHNPDVRIGEFQVVSETQLFGQFIASNAAKLGPRDLVVRTGEQELILPDAVVVTEVAPSLDDVRPYLRWNVHRRVDERGTFSEQAEVVAGFFVPLVPACGGAVPPPRVEPPRFDIPVRTVLPDGGGREEDCPIPKSVDAGETVLLRGDSASIVLRREVNRASGQILYRASEQAAKDYVFGETFDLVIDGSGDMPATEIPDVLHTVHGDVVLTGPSYGPHSRVDGLPVSWVPTSADPTTGEYLLSVYGDLSSLDGRGWVAVVPWDDGEYIVPATDLVWLAAGDATVVAERSIEGPEFGLPFSKTQYSRATSEIVFTRPIWLK